MARCHSMRWPVKSKESERPSLARFAAVRRCSRNSMTGGFHWWNGDASEGADKLCEVVRRTEGGHAPTPQRPKRRNHAIPARSRGGHVVRTTRMDCPGTGGRTTPPSLEGGVRLSAVRRGERREARRPSAPAFSASGLRTRRGVSARRVDAVELSGHARRRHDSGVIGRAERVTQACRKDTDEAARRASVYPGIMRRLRAKYRLDYGK